MTDVALLTDRRYTAATAAADDWYLGNILADDRLLQDALARRGLSSARVDWADPAIDWSTFRCGVFRTTWDYYERFAEFRRWLDRVSSLTRLINPLATVIWNADKHYLADLEAAGVPIVPTVFLEQGSALDLVARLAALGWSEAVIKPCVSGGARHTYRFTCETAANVEPVVRQVLAEESFLLQPFEPYVLASGEDSLMVLDGVYSHAIRKLPKPGDFRVQDDHGGTVRPRQPDDEQIALAVRAAAAAGDPAYARVDLVRGRAGGWAVMELELIEPELWLRCHPPAAELFAAAIANQLWNSDSTSQPS